jgi:hypothetical protein
VDLVDTSGGLLRNSFIVAFARTHGGGTLTPLNRIRDDAEPSWDLMLERIVAPRFGQACERAHVVHGIPNTLQHIKYQQLEMPQH